MMRRDIGNEVVVAIAVVSVLAFALIFGIILSLTGAPQGGAVTTEAVSAPDESAVDEAENSTLAPSETRTLIVILPSATATPSPTITDTPAPTRDFESEINAISTQVAAALTATTTVTVDTNASIDSTTTDTATRVEGTRAGTRTRTATPRATNTQVRITEASSATNTPRATNTASATRTPTQTQSSTRTATLTSAPANTSTTAASTATEQATNSPRATNTTTATNTQGVVATSLALSSEIAPPMRIGGATATLIPVTPMGSACSVPRGWITFAVPENTTLYTIARTVGSNVGELRLINCLGDFDNITPASLIYLPVRPAGMATGIPVLPTALTLDESACAVDNVTITEPVAGSEITGVFTVRGMATLGDFRSYRIEVRPAYSDRYDFYLQRNEPGIVEGGELGIVNSDLYEDGLHYLRLSVRTGSGHQSCEIPVIFR